MEEVNIPVDDIPETVIITPKPTQVNEGDKELYKLKGVGSSKKISRNVNNLQRRSIR